VTRTLPSRLRVGNLREVFVFVFVPLRSGVCSVAGLDRSFTGVSSSIIFPFSSSSVRRLRRSL